MKIEKIYQVVEDDYDGHTVHRTFVDKSDAEEFAATYARVVEDCVEIEEHTISSFSPDASVWWEIKGFRHDTPQISVLYKRVYWSDEANPTEPDGDPAVEYGISAQGSEMITVLSRTQEGARYGLNQAMLTRWKYNPIAETDAYEERKKAMLSLIQAYELLGGGGSLGGGGA